MSDKTSKSRVSEELEQLREKGLAKSHRDTFNDSDTFRTPEEAKAYLDSVRIIKNKQEKPTPPTNLSSADLNDWYSQQRQRELTLRKNKEEAEAFLRGYRSTMTYGGGPPSPSRRGSGNSHISHGTAIIDDESQVSVSSQVEKLDTHIMKEDSIVEEQAEAVTKPAEELINEIEEEQVETAEEPVEEQTKDIEEETAETKDADPTEDGENEENSTGGDEDSVPEVKDEEVTSSATQADNEEVEEKEDIAPSENKIEDVVEETPSPKEQSVETPKDDKQEDAGIEFKKREDIETKTSSESSPGEDGWRFLISKEPGAKFAPEPDRYHLYVAYACPWAHRTVVVRNLKGLQDVIGVTYVHPTWQYTQPGEDEHRGWVFGSEGGKTLTNTSGIGSFPSNWGDEDPIMGAKSIREIYLKVNDTTGKYILPILWDNKLETIVSNESSEIIRVLNSEFNEFAKNPDLDLYPSEFAKEIDEVNKWIYPTFNNGVYRCGLSSTQESYDEAIDELTASFDKIDAILQKKRYLVGNFITEADVRLFVTLFRFDEVYDVYFKCNTRCVARTPALLNYVRDIYQMPGVTETCRMDMIKAHYYTSHVELNKYSIIPRGDNFQGLLDQPHGRSQM